MDIAMKSLLLAASAALLVTAPAIAQDNGTRHYVGDFTCRYGAYATEWVISPSAGHVAATVYYQEHGSRTTRWIELVEQRGREGPGLYDANGNLYLQLNGNSERMQATWANHASPSTDCAPFIMQRATSGQERFDAIFALMDTPAPDDAVAVQVGELTRSAPFVQALPELDQQSYARKYQTLEKSFWENYRSQLISDLASLPLSTDAERQSFAHKVSGALSGGLAYDVGYDAHDFAYAVLRQAADRLAVSGAPVAETLFAGAAETCSAFQSILARNNGYSFKKVEVAARVPTDYWTREMADSVLAMMRSCEGISQDYARELTGKWPDFQQRQEEVAALVAEQARLMALPVSLDTLVSTDNLRPDDAVLQSRNRHDYRDRFFGTALEPRRAELFEASLAAITTAAAQELQADINVQPAVVQYCEQLGSVSNLSYEQRSLARQTCDTAMREVVQRQAQASIVQVRQAFAAAAPESEAAEAARALCDDLRSNLSYELYSSIQPVCAEEIGKLSSLEKSLQCDRALTASGGPKELLDSTLAVAGGGSVSMRDFVCQSSGMNAPITFASSGFMLWQQQLMHVHTGNKDEPPLVFILTPPAEGPHWALSVEDDATKVMLEQSGLDIQYITACIMQRPTCQYI